MIQLNGLSVVVSDLLPIDEVLMASNIETKEEIRITTGKKLNCIHIEAHNLIAMSQKIYDKLEKELILKNKLL